VASANWILFGYQVPYWVTVLMMVVLILLSLFLIFIILLQKGKGGGLAGAFGGAGGSSAFGSRAGDTFTRVTIYVALFWALLIMVTISKILPAAVNPHDQSGQQSQPVPQGPLPDAP
jgi:preprotein translocase subunit SecG